MARDDDTGSDYNITQALPIYEYALILLSLS